MKIKSQAQLVFEMKKVREALASKNVMLIEKYRNDYMRALAVPKNDIYREGTVTICSANSSYHLLALYTLLDIIDYYWDGYRFHEKELKSGYSLLSELSLKVEAKSLELEEYIPFLKRPSSIKQSEPLNIFLLPFVHSKKYVIKRSVPGNILIIYANTTDKFKLERTLYEGLAEFYLKDKLNHSLPSWAKNEQVYIDEFIAWCKGKSSMFRI